MPNPDSDDGCSSNMMTVLQSSFAKMASGSCAYLYYCIL